MVMDINVLHPVMHWILDHGDGGLVVHPQGWHAGLIIDHVCEETGQPDTVTCRGHHRNVFCFT